MTAPSSASVSSDEVAHAKQHGTTPDTQVHEKSTTQVGRTNDVLEEVKLETETLQEERDRTEGETEYPASWRLGVIFLALCLAVSFAAVFPSQRDLEIVL